MDTGRWIDADEIARVVAAFMAVRRGRIVTRVEAEQVIAWANSVRMQASALDLVARGALGVDIVDGRITFPTSAGLEMLLRELFAPEPEGGETTPARRTKAAGNTRLTGRD